MYIVIIEKPIEVLGTTIVKREYITVHYKENIPQSLKWYASNGWKFAAVFKGEDVSDEEWEEIAKTAREVLK